MESQPSNQARQAQRARVCAIANYRTGLRMECFKENGNGPFRYPSKTLCEIAFESEDKRGQCSLRTALFSRDGLFFQSELLRRFVLPAFAARTAFSTSVIRVSSGTKNDDQKTTRRHRLAAGIMTGQTLGNPSLWLIPPIITPFLIGNGVPHCSLGCYYQFL